MAEYTVSGEFETSGGVQRFTRTVEAPNENVAEERAYALFGSEHDVRRTRITLADVEVAE